MIHLTFHECTSYFGCLSSQSPLREDRGKMILVKRLEADFRNMSNKEKRKKNALESFVFQGFGLQHSKYIPFVSCMHFFFHFLPNKKKIKVLAFGRRN